MAIPTDALKQIEYYATALKAPRIRDSAARLADQARDAGWTHEEYLSAVLSREVSSRESSGSELRIRAAGFPSRKAIEEFSFDHQPGLSRDTIAHLATSAFIAKADNVVLLGPPGTGKTHLSIGLGIAAAQHGHRVLFATAVDWVARLQAAHQHGRLAAELAKLRRYALLIVDLCRPCDYAGMGGGLVVGVLVRAGFGACRLGVVIGIVTGLPGRRASCLWGGNGRVWRPRGWSARGLFP
jgi:DNA replication protein DnaC